MEYKSQKDLYMNLVPALNVKVKLLKRNNYKNITREDIWNYLKEIRWIKSKGLSLAEMVSDVLNTEDAYIDNYLRHKLNLNTRSVYFNED